MVFARWVDEFNTRPSTQGRRLLIDDFGAGLRADVRQAELGFHERLSYAQLRHSGRPSDRVLDVGRDAGSATRPPIQPRDASSGRRRVGVRKVESKLSRVEIAHDDLSWSAVVSGGSGPEVQFPVLPVRPRHSGRIRTQLENAEWKWCLDEREIGRA